MYQIGEEVTNGSLSNFIMPLTKVQVNHLPQILELDFGPTPAS